jgi:hypothetical protein
MPSNSPTVKRQRVSRSGRSRSEAVAAAANARRRTAANAAKRHKLLGLLVLAHLASAARANTRPRRTNTRARRATATRPRRRPAVPKGLGFF